MTWGSMLDCIRAGLGDILLKQGGTGGGTGDQIVRREKNEFVPLAQFEG